MNPIEKLEHLTAEIDMFLDHVCGTIEAIKGDIEQLEEEFCRVQNFRNKMENIIEQMEVQNVEN